MLQWYAQLMVVVLSFRHVYFSEEKRKPILMDHTPPSSKGFFQESGWMTCEMFVKYMEHFIAFANSSKNNAILLIFDGHCSHTRSFEPLEIARQNGIILLSLPPHSTHRLQP